MLSLTGQPMFNRVHPNTVVGHKKEESRRQRAKCVIKSQSSTINLFSYVYHFVVVCVSSFTTGVASLFGHLRSVVVSICR